MIKIPQTVKLRSALSYRRRMRVRELMVFRFWQSETSFYVCPRCGITLDREFTKYCNRCGQCLDWTMYMQAKIVYPEKGTGPRKVILGPAHS